VEYPASSYKYLIKQKLDLMTKLSVNVNKIALIRNSRGDNQPNLIEVAKDIESFGAEGITVHPRPDQRHVRYDDIAPLKDIVTTEFNIEGYPSDEFIKLVLVNAPHQVTLVPDPPGVLTSSEGWNIKESAVFLKELIKKFKYKGIRVSLFIEPSAQSVAEAKEVGADRVELYTGHYAEGYKLNKEQAVAPYRNASDAAKQYEIGLNAGHDLNLENLKYFKENTENLLEVSIGHALVIDSIYFGLKNTIQMYLAQLAKI
jgi:pyridoxine 5-phosphate synthase